jgi:hypothetical protein
MTLLQVTVLRRGPLFGHGNRPVTRVTGRLHQAAVATLRMVVLATLTAFSSRELIAQRRFVLESSPAVTIGREGNERTEFSIIVGAARLPSGRIAVADLSTSNVRVFDSTGVLVATHGRRGRGPSEFEDVNWVGTSADTVFIFDASLRRLSAVDHATNRVSSIQADVREDRLTIYPVGRLLNGTLVTLPIRPTSMRHPDGLYRDSIVVRLLRDLNDKQPRDLGPFGWLTHLAVNPRNAERAMAVGAYPFGPRLFVRATGRMVALGDSEHPTIRFVDSGGRTLSEVRLPWPSRDFDEALISAARKRALASARTEEVRITLEARYARKYRSTRQPHFSRMIEGFGGTVWVERFRVDLAEPAEYAIVSSAGVIATAEIPAGFEPLHASERHLIGRAVNSDGVPTIAVYRFSVAR